MILAGAAFRLLSSYEIVAVIVTLLIFCVFLPMWQYFLQRHKVTLEGPWVLVHPTTEASPDQSK